jgi:hypothetical protein
MDETTITTAFGVLPVAVTRRGGSWVARLQSAPGNEDLVVPPSVGPDRDSAVRGLTWAVRSLALERGLTAPGVRPGSWDVCP